MHHFVATAIACRAHCATPLHHRAVTGGALPGQDIARDDGTVHVFNVVNDQGDILSIDGQTGRLADGEFTEHVTQYRILPTNDWAIE